MSAASAQTSGEQNDKKCQIAEILQYACEIENASGGSPPEIHCYPIPRIFRLCPGRPAIEITRYVDTDPKTGELEISAEAKQIAQGEAVVGCDTISTRIR